MKLNVAKNSSDFKAMMSSALMLSLALMLLVFSCPMKKMLTKKSTHTTSAIRTNQTNQRELNNGDEDIVINSCSVRKDAKLIKSTVSKEIKSFQPVLSNQSLHSASFSKPYYFASLTGSFNTTNSASYALPLFLKHLSLLI